MSYTLKLDNPPKLDFNGSEFLLRPPHFPSNAVKDEAQARWDSNRRIWVLPGLTIYAHTVLDMYPQLPITEAAADRLDQARPKQVPWTHMPEDLDPIYQKLYPFQQEAVSRLVYESLKGPQANQLVVLSPGLGKTVVSLMAARLLHFKNVLVVCIKDLMRQWQDEEEKWFGERTFGKLHKAVPDGEGWYVANYDTVVGNNYQSAFLKHKWDLVILDESVLVKNRRTRRFKKLLELRMQGPRIWELSGSPTTRYPDDLWAQMHLLYPEAFRSYWRFAKRYCYTEFNKWSGGETITGTREDRDPADDLKDLMFVKNQKDVLSELPEEIPVLVPVTLTKAQQKAYHEMNEEWITKLESGEKVEAKIVLSQMIRLQQITSNLVNIDGPDESAKADAVADMLEARSFAFPALIWTNWVPGAEALLKRLRKAEPDLRIEWIHGAEGKKGEEYNERTFLDYKAGKVDILILAMPVGKFGHNLQNTHTVIYYDKTWNADDFVQSMHRVKRIGLDHRPVVMTLKAEGTVDEMVEENLAGKLLPISKISQSDLASMLRTLTGVGEE